MERKDQYMYLQSMCIGYVFYSIVQVVSILRTDRYFTLVEDPETSGWIV